MEKNSEASDYKNSYFSSFNLEPALELVKSLKSRDSTTQTQEQ